MIPDNPTAATIESSNMFNLVTDIYLGSYEILKVPTFVPCYTSLCQRHLTLFYYTRPRARDCNHELEKHNYK